MQTFYIGYTSDVERRLNEHKKRRPGFELLYFEAYPSAALAREREIKLKQYGSAWRGLKKRINAA